jgi:hypothetical protein
MAASKKAASVRLTVIIIFDLSLPGMVFIILGLNLAVPVKRLQ